MEGKIDGCVLKQILTFRELHMDVVFATKG